jgi:hypothetical protein
MGTGIGNPLNSQIIEAARTKSQMTMGLSVAIQALGTTTEDIAVAIGTVTTTGTGATDKTAACMDPFPRPAGIFTHGETLWRPTAKPVTANGTAHRSATTAVATAEW